MKYVNRLSDQGLVIFLFHGVTDASGYAVRNYTNKHIAVDVFEDLILSLKNNGVPLSMEEVYNYKKRSEPYPKRSFAITFDDGFENNYSVAAPILERLKIPAAFYVTTDFIENKAMSWTDRIEYAFERTVTGRITIDKEFFFKDSVEKLTVLEYIRNYIKNNSQVDVEMFTADVFKQLQVDPIFSSDDPLDKKMSWEQLKELKANKLFIIGGHTHTHKIMSFLDSKELEKEVDISMELLQKKADVVIRHYSYPEGMKHCYSEKVISVLKKRGIICCPAVEDGINMNDEDLFTLKRIVVV